MKKIILTLALAALTLVLSGTQAQAQVPTQTRVAIVNIGKVLTKYEKAKFYKSEMEGILKPYKDKGEDLKKKMIEGAENIKKIPATDTKNREAWEQYLLKLKRDFEDLDGQARKAVGKKQEDQIVTLFKDVQATIQAYAQANGIHMVLGYGEQVEGDLFSFPNINRKMSGMDLGSTSPLFHVPGVDISDAIAETMNSRYRAAAGGAVPATTTSSPGKN